MKDLLKKKPRGFCVGKVYETSIEDKLLEELEQSRQAQSANVNRKKEVSKWILSTLVNLRKKNNIQRHLKSAFQGIPCIIDITPFVFGNKKTKIPSARILLLLISSVKRMRLGISFHPESYPLPCTK
ncbi:RNA binding protein [Quillaja saponaria]|uniref:RNA binding protein n=1 Tax=Quillaja saponaria TaxID=32244 RepID=A0AAD7L8T6_QUISA|nr:RNA binding protein [Quillaja saponaria]